LQEPDLILYSTSACHLCEQAEQWLLPWVERGRSVAVDDIADSDELFARYGEKIPVVRRTDTGAELAWPFDPESLGRFLD
jgi:hypothetical protein